jgi:hypothetical protein
MNACKGFAASALLALGLAPTAHAGDELYLRWDNCFGDGGVYNKVFACDTNAGAEFLVGSFRLAATIDSVAGLDITVDLQALGPTMPLWWAFRSGECRQGLLFGVFSRPTTSSVCLDPWTPLGAAGGAASAQSSGNMGRILAVVGLPSPNSFTAQAGEENFAFQLRISHSRTVGSPACGGCSTPVCIAWGQARIGRASQSLPYLPRILGATTPGNGSNATWQPGAVATTYGGCDPRGFCDSYVTCQSATPARGSTWGSIKSLYRR